MPGEAGPKVKCTPGSPINQQKKWKVALPKWLIELTICYCALSGWQRFWRPPWSSWRKRAQSKYEEREFGVWWLENEHHERLLSVSKNKILQSLISRPWSLLITVAVAQYSVLTTAWGWLVAQNATSHPSYVCSSVDRQEFWTSGAH